MTNHMLKNFDFDLITFDCYGTLINWETGIFSALKPILANHGKNISDSQLLELYGQFELEAEAGEYRNYREVLISVVKAFGKHLQFTPTVDELEALPDSVRKWRPWPDTVDALRRLSKRYRLAIISNIDDDLFATTRPHLAANFDSITTAQQARCYKPGRKIFEMALQRAKTTPEKILHVGQSIYHDVLPAQSFGLATVWVNRPSPRTGIGAVVQADGKPDLEVRDLATLAEKAAC
jgi:2-haloacid dehalogenase